MDNKALTTRETEAYILHSQIMAAGHMAAQSMVEMCKYLKRMRDTALYTEMGYANFDDYVTGAVGIRQRQAYTYISVYERLGETVLTEHAGLGITKLEQFAQLPPTERDEIAEQNDLAGMSVREIKELVAKSTQQGEQISLLAATVREKDEKIESERARADALEADCQRQAEEIADLQARPTEIITQGPTDAEIEKIRKDAAKEARDKERAKQEKAIEAAKKSAADTAKAETEKAFEAKMATLSANIETAKQRADKLEKELALAGDDSMLRFKLYFDAVQENVSKMVSVLNEVKQTDAAMAQKMGGAIYKYGHVLEEMFGKDGVGNDR